MTRFEYGDIQLDVGGRIVEGNAVAMIDHQSGVYYCRDGVPKQVIIEARLVEIRLEDQEIFGVEWFSGMGPLIAATDIKNTTPMKSPPIALGGVIGIGTGGGGDGGACPHGGTPGTCPQCHSGGGETSIDVPVIAGSGGKDSEKVTSVRAIFDLNESVDIDNGYIALKIKVGVAKNGNILVQPILIPTTVLQRGDTPPVPPTKKITTAVSIQDGQTVLIGGLVEDEDKDIKKKIPILGDIPLLGRIFKSRDTTVTKRNLIIFVTPHIIRGD
jgi:hypothetical protein